MSFSILLVSHPGIAPAILDNARRIWPGNVPATEVLEVPFDAQTESLLLSLNEQLDRLMSAVSAVLTCQCCYVPIITSRNLSPRSVN
jgi:hypothetical protein